MISIYSIIKELEATPSRLAKEAILKREIDNEELKKFFVLALDPFINFYIKKIPEPIFQKNPIYIGSAFSLLELIIKREKTGNEAIEHLAKILGALAICDRDVLERVIKKAPDCGVSESTVNKIWPKLVPEYPCMLCSQYEEKVMKKITFPAYFQLKADGMRFNAIVKDGQVEYRSRNGKLLDLKGQLDDGFIAMAVGLDVVFDGELLVFDKDGKPMERQKGNGILAKTIKGTISEKEAKMIGCMLWDVIKIKCFEAGTGKDTYKERYFGLQYCRNQIWDKDWRYTIIPTYTVNSFEEVQEHLEKFLEAGQEGGILKDFNSIWEDKRSRQQIKFKGELECDLKCTGWIQHSKKPEWLGALTLESDDGIVKVNVGSGFNEEHRKNIKVSDVIGKIISVKYNCRISDKKTKQDSLFLPVFIEIREDKIVADKGKDIK